jgi:hypothetical protein
LLFTQYFIDFWRVMRNYARQGDPDPCSKRGGLGRRQTVGWIEQGDGRLLGQFPFFLRFKKRYPAVTAISPLV